MIDQPNLLCCTAGMAKPPRRPSSPKRKSEVPAGNAVASRAVVPRTRDPRQPGTFDAPRPRFVRPQLAKLVAGRRALGARAEVRWIPNARAHRWRKSAAHYRAIGS